MAKVRRCGVAFGSNLGDRLENLREAREMLLDRAGKDGEEVLSSPVYETEPVDCAEGAPAFLNAVVEMGTLLDPAELLAVTQGIERELGRPEVHGRNTPRTVDLDLLYVGELEIDTEDLVVPHPKMSERRFVLEPLSRIRPDLLLGGRKATVEEVLAELDFEKIEEVAGADWKLT